MFGKRRNVPEHLRRAIRLAISVGIAAATGFSLLGPLGGWHSRWGSQTMMGTKWAAITSVVCNAPVIAKTTEVALERVLGTVTGGLLGYGLAIVNDTLPFLDQPVFTVVAATFVAFMSIVLGYKMRLDYSGRLFIMTFMLVVMAAPKTSDAFIVAVTRISGIIFGVITTMVMSVVVFPKSASHQATDNLQAGLSALARLNRVAWRRGRGCTATADILRPAAIRHEESSAAVPSEVMRRSDSDPDSVQVLVGEEGSSHNGSAFSLDDCCDEVLSEVYAKMLTCQEYTKLSRSETYVFTSRGRWCLVPAFKCLPWRTALPEKEMSQVIAAARKVARLLWCLHTSIPEAADSPVLARYPGVMEFLASLGSSLQVYFENLSASFPNQQSLETDQLFTFIEGVETLISASHRASRDSTIILNSPWAPDGSSGAKAEDPASRGLPAHAAARSPDCNIAYICEAGGLVTQVSAAGTKALDAPRESLEPGYDGKDLGRYSPVSEVLGSGFEKDAVLRAAAEAQPDYEPKGVDTKEDYLSQVSWQATQFLLRRLTQELVLLNSSFIRLSVLLPPTRWESRRRKRQKGTEEVLQQPLLQEDRRAPA